MSLTCIHDVVLGLLTVIPLAMVSGKGGKIQRSLMVVVGPRVHNALSH